VEGVEMRAMAFSPDDKRLATDGLGGAWIFAAHRERNY
jgi:hypothetical protein